MGNQAQALQQGSMNCSEACHREYHGYVIAIGAVDHKKALTAYHSEEQLKWRQVCFLALLHEHNCCCCAKAVVCSKGGAARFEPIALLSEADWIFQEVVLQSNHYQQ